jgi:hypothetical protein
VLTLGEAILTILFIRALYRLIRRLLGGNVPPSRPQPVEGAGATV